MKEYVLSSAGQRFTEIPRETWEQHIEQAPKLREIPGHPSINSLKAHNLNAKRS